MTTDTAKEFGGRRAIVNHLIALGLWELALIVYTCIKDPHVGVIFLVFVQINTIVVVYSIVLMSAIYICGRRAGTEILNNSDGYLKTGLKYALVISLVTLIPVMVIWYAVDSNILWPALFITGTMAAVWLITVRQISGRIASEMES